MAPGRALPGGRKDGKCPTSSPRDPQPQGGPAEWGDGSRAERERERGEREREKLQQGERLIDSPPPAHSRRKVEPAPWAGTLPGNRTSSNLWVQGSRPSHSATWAGPGWRDSWSFSWGRGATPLGSDRCQLANTWHVSLSVPAGKEAGNPGSHRDGVPDAISSPPLGLGTGGCRELGAPGH